MGLSLYWTRELSVGIERIDRQHRQLFEHANRLLGACLAGDGAPRSREMLNFLCSYAAEHFRDEEALMESSGYHFLAVHKRQHQLFCKRLEQFAERLVKEGPDDIVEGLNEMVIDWLYEHVCMEDRALGCHLNQQSA